MPSPNWIPDVVATLVDGQNAGLEPELLPPTQFAYGRNLSIRGGRARSRPSLVPLTLNVPLLTGEQTDAFGNTIPSVIQGATFFSKVGGQLIVSIAGRVFQIDPVRGTNIELTNPGLANNPYFSNTTGTNLANAVNPMTGAAPYDYANPLRGRHWYAETASSLVIQDGQQTPWIWDGANWKHSVIAPGQPQNTVPVGTVMCYSNGRLAVAIGDGTQVMLGDIVQGDVYQSELNFTETYGLLGGGTFTFPSRVRSLSSLPVVDSASGQGSLVVGLRQRCSTLHTEVTARETWDNIGFQAEMFPDVGIPGPNATCGVNQDLFFRAKDGLRSVMITYGDYDSPGLTPFSTEVNNRLNFDSDMWLGDAVVRYFDDRILMTHSPVAYGPRSIALGLLSLNTDIVVNRGQKNPAAFEGDWDGVQIAEIVVGEFGGTDRCFIVGRDSVTGANGIWEVMTEVAQTYAPTETPTYVLDTRAIGGSGLNAMKRLNRTDVWVSEIKDPITMNVYFRPDKYPYWIQWDTLTIPVTPATPWTNQRQISRGPFSTMTPPDTFDAVSQQSLDIGYNFQVRLAWTGRCRVDYVQILTEQLEAPDAANQSDSTVQTQQFSGPPANQIDDQFWFPFTSQPQP